MYAVKVKNIIHDLKQEGKENLFILSVIPDGIRIGNDINEVLATSLVPHQVGELVLRRYRDNLQEDKNQKGKYCVDYIADGLAGQHIVVVKSINITSNTIAFIYYFLQAHNPLSVSFLILASKPPPDNYKIEKEDERTLTFRINTKIKKYYCFALEGGKYHIGENLGTHQDKTINAIQWNLPGIWEEVKK